MATQETIEMLKCHGIKPSAQRISIMEYLLNHRTHRQLTLSMAIW